MVDETDNDRRTKEASSKVTSDETQMKYDRTDEDEDLKTNIRNK